MLCLGAQLALPLLALLLPATSLPFAEDDECDGSDGSECALQALQRRAVQGQGRICFAFFRFPASLMTRR